MSTYAERPESDTAIRARRPWVVGLLSVVTLGIYTLVWYYLINRDMRDYGASRDHQELAGSKPWKSVLAVTIGGLVVVPKIVSYLHTISRLQTIERLGTGVSRPTVTAKTLLVGSVVAALGSSIRGVGVAFALVSLAAFSTAAAVIQSRVNAACQASRVHPSGIAVAEPSARVSGVATTLGAANEQRSC